MIILFLIASLYWVQNSQAQYVSDFYTPQIQTYISSNPYLSTIHQFPSNDYYQPQFLAYNIQQQYDAQENENYQPRSSNNELNQTETLNDIAINQANINSVLKNFELPRISALPSDNYRGFGYHTKFNGGASSTVVFFTGPSAINQRSRNIQEHITVASDSLDPQVPQIEQRLNNIFNSPSQEIPAEQAQFYSPLSPIVRTLIENPEPLSNVFRFYAEPQTGIDFKQSRSLDLERATDNNNTTESSVESTSENQTTMVQSTTESRTESSTISASTSVLNNSTATQNTTTEKI